MQPSPITLSSPLGDDLRFHTMTHRAGLSELGQTDLKLLSARPDLPPEALLGLPVSVALQLREGQRHFTGHVTRFGLVGMAGTSSTRPDCAPGCGFSSATATAESSRTRACSAS
jgi:uncharacterized protein involved in type VI secretion and phage assembly